MAGFQINPFSRETVAGLLFFGAIGSVFFGMFNLLHFGTDCQIEGARWLINGKSPYVLFLENRSLFRFTRFPNLLPQGYYLLAPFALLGDKVGYVLYGIVGVLLTFVASTLYYRSKSSLCILLLVLVSLPYRNNLGNGQFLFFYLGIFLLFYYFIENKKNKLFTFLINPLLLLCLLGKPTIFFWVFLFFPLNSRMVQIYLMYIFLQIGAFYAFSIQTQSTIIAVIKNYDEVLRVHMIYQNSVYSLFAIKFNSILSIMGSVFVFLNLGICLSVVYLNWFLQVPISKAIWMFVCICLSFILVYHRYYESFMFLAPLLVWKKNDGAVSANFFYYLLVSMILSKVIFVIIKDEFLSYRIVHLITIFLVFLIQLDFLKSISFKKKTINLDLL